MRAEVVIMRGCSGMGKSTLAERLNRNFGPVSILSAGSLDTPSVHAMCMKSFLDALHEDIELGTGGIIVVDNVNATREEYLPYVLVARALGYEPTLVHVAFNPEYISGNRGGLSREQVMAQWRSWENPASDHPREILTMTRSAHDVWLELVEHSVERSCKHVLATLSKDEAARVRSRLYGSTLEQAHYLLSKGDEPNHVLCELGLLDG